MQLRSFINVVIFCPGNSLEVAEAAARMLSECAEVHVWQAAFNKHPGRDWLNALEKILSGTDYAVFLLPPDGRCREEQLESQQNLHIEIGLAMARLGRESVFLICDPKVTLSHYLQGVVPTVYDSSDPKTLEEACGAVAERITSSRFSYLSGPWKSEYLVHFIRHLPLTIESVIVVGLMAGIKIISVDNEWDDKYIAVASFDLSNGHLVGDWKSIKGRREGWFVLYLSECGKILRGRYTGKDECGMEIEGYWVLAKNDAGEGEVMARLNAGRKRLPRIIWRSRARRAFLTLKTKASKLNSKFLGLFLMF